MTISYLRIGQGFDIHRYASGRPLILGGIKLTHDYGLAGDSDGDCVTHAIIDAILGALHWGNLGTYFPQEATDSYHVLRQLGEQLHQQQILLHNIDGTIIAEAPRLTPWIPKIEANIADALHVAHERISLKPKTHDQLDAIGQQTALAVHVVLLLSIPSQTDIT